MTEPATLEYDEKEEHGAEGCRDRDSANDDPTLPLGCQNSEEEESEGQLERNHGQDVEAFCDQQKLESC
jgi:hypothetical protein